MSNPIQNTESYDPLESLRNITPARVAGDTIGVSLKTHEVMRFRQDFANTKDALAHSLDIHTIQEKINKAGNDYITLKSKILNREEYLLRPDLGRMLDAESEMIISTSTLYNQVDVCICITDGLSANAVNQQCMDVINLLLPRLQHAHISIGPVCLIENGRVAISDQIGSLMHAKISVIFIGERPGLSSPESMGIYLTYTPKIGNTDANRNCISNIWKNGLQPNEAADTLLYLINTSLQQQISGVELKDHSRTPTEIKERI